MIQKPVPIPINLGIQQACLFHLDAGQGDRGTPTGLEMITFQTVEQRREQNTDYNKVASSYCPYFTVLHLLVG